MYQHLNMYTYYVFTISLISVNHYCLLPWQLQEPAQVPPRPSREFPSGREQKLCRTFWFFETPKLIYREDPRRIFQSLWKLENLPSKTLLEFKMGGHRSWPKHLPNPCAGVPVAKLHLDGWKPIVISPFLAGQSPMSQFSGVSMLE